MGLVNSEIIAGNPPEKAGEGLRRFGKVLPPMFFGSWKQDPDAFDEGGLGPRNS